MLNKVFNHKKTPFVLLGIFALISAASIHYFPGTGDAGDSIHHYLFARYAPKHPELYFHHWAKPLFVLLASPFAQFGFTGMKLFNALCTLITMYLTYQCAIQLRYKNASLSILFLMFSPLYYILTYSGLTEPLFALFLAWGLLQALKEKYLSSAVIISFLPYVRSEGLIIAGVFLVYLLVRRQWKVLPFLLSGSVLYGIAGAFVHHSLFWVFTEIPYSTLSSVYGHGDLSHFIIQLINVTGIPLYILFWIGVVVLVVNLFQNKSRNDELFLLLGIAAAFIVAHSLFWYLGIFNSMGLKRVLIGIIPCLALLSLRGFNFLTSEIFVRYPAWSGLSAWLLLFYVLVFPFTDNPAAMQWEQDMYLSPDQELAQKSLTFLKENNYKGNLIYNYYYLSVLNNEDYFEDPGKHRISPRSIKNLQTGDVLIWDSDFTVEETGIHKEQLDSNRDLKSLFNYTSHSFGRDHVFAGYTKNTEN